VQFDVERTTVLGRPALTVRGELDLATAPRLAAAAESLLSQQPQSLVVDLTGTTFLDSSGARELARVARRAAAAGVAAVAAGGDPEALLDDVLTALDPPDTDDVTLVGLGRT
jgi:anti-anti-sigma factor